MFHLQEGRRKGPLNTPLGYNKILTEDMQVHRSSVSSSYAAISALKALFLPTAHDRT